MIHLCNITYTATLQLRPPFTATITAFWLTKQIKTPHICWLNYSIISLRIQRDWKFSAMELEDVNHLFLISIDLKFLTTQKTCRQSGLLQLFLQGVPSAFPLHCLLLDLPVKKQYHKVNRCLARYSPRAKTTNRSFNSNRAPNKPAWPGPIWPKMPILGQIWSFLGKNPFFYWRNQKFCYPHNGKPT